MSSQRRGENPCPTAHHRRLLRRSDLHRDLPGQRSRDRAAPRSSIRCSTTTIAPARPRPSRPTAVLAKAAERGLQIDWMLETHAHADHLTGGAASEAKTGAQVAIGEHISEVQKIFKPVFDASDVSGDGREFDRLCPDGERLPLGSARRSRSCTCPATRRPTSPTGSATPCSSATRCSCPTTAPRAPISRAATPRSSTARSAGCCRCRPRRGCSCATTTRRPAAIATRGRPRSRDERAHNVHVHDGIAEDEFVAMRTKRDATPRRAGAAAAVDAGQHPRRQAAAGRGERRQLPPHSDTACRLTVAPAASLG